MQELIAKATLSELRESEEISLKEAEKFWEKFEEAMEDDFNTADAIAAIFELVKFSNTNADSESSKVYIQALYR